MLLKRWQEATVYLAGQPIKLRLMAMRYSEAAEFTRKVAEHNRKALEGKADFWETFPEAELRPVFARYVKLAEEVSIEDGPAVTSGDALLDIATLGVVQAVVGKLYDLSRLSEAQGKASSSPSTSEPARATNDGDFPATSTEPEAGTAH